VAAGVITQAVRNCVKGSKAASSSSSVGAIGMNGRGRKRRREGGREGGRDLE